MHVLKIEFYSKPGKLCTKEFEMKLPVTQCCIIQTTQPFTPHCTIPKQELVADSTFAPDRTTRSTKTVYLLHILGWQLNKGLSICVIDYIGTSVASDMALMCSELCTSICIYVLYVIQ